MYIKWEETLQVQMAPTSSAKAKCHWPSMDVPSKTPSRWCFPTQTLVWAGPVSNSAVAGYLFYLCMK